MPEAIERGEIRLTLDPAAVCAADRAARIWEAGQPGPIVLGSEAHKQAFCRMLLDTHNPYRPSVVDWPILEREARDRLVSLPIWDIAMQTEGNASLRVLSYAQTLADPLLREAVEIDGFEETRHKQVLSTSSRLTAFDWPQSPNTSVRDIPSGRSCSPVFANASIPFSPSAFSRWPSGRGFSRPNSSTLSSPASRRTAALPPPPQPGRLATAAVCPHA